MISVDKIILSVGQLLSNAFVLITAVCYLTWCGGMIHWEHEVGTGVIL